VTDKLTVLVICTDYVDGQAVTSKLALDSAAQASNTALRPSVTENNASPSFGPGVTLNTDTWTPSVKIEQSNTATITPAPTLNECAQSWLSYLSESQSWYSATQKAFIDKQFSYYQAGMLKETCLVSYTSIFTWEEVRKVSSMSGYTLCPGESSRYKLITTSLTRLTLSETRTVQTNCTSSYPKSILDDLGPEPLAPHTQPACTILPEDCRAQFELLKPFSFESGYEQKDGGLAINNHNSDICGGYVTKYSCSNRFSGQGALDSAEYMNTVLPMLVPGFDGFQFFKPDSCLVSINNFALIYFPPDIATRDICANNGWGTWVESPSKVGALVTAKTSLISLTDLQAGSK
jgi:hypothetical protein